jgi:hypothetical protein
MSYRARLVEGQELASQPYWHPNGFAKFVIYDEPATPLRLRLHVWVGEDSLARQESQNVHGHRWNFGSAVIAGPALQIDEYIVNDGQGETYLSYHYQPRRRSGAAGGANLTVSWPELEAVGEVLLEHSVSYTVAVNETYLCDITRLHTVHSRSADLTATLIVQGPELLPVAPVFQRPGQPPQQDSRAMGGTDARDLLAATIDAVQGSGGRHELAR